MQLARSWATAEGRSPASRKTAGTLGRVAAMALIAGTALAAPWGEAAGQATPAAPPGVTAGTTALLVSATNDPLRVTGSDGMVHLEYDLVLTSVFAGPVSLESIEVLEPGGTTVHVLSGETLKAMTQPLLGDAPTDEVPASGAVAVLLDVVVPPDAIPSRLSHRVAYRLPPDARLAAIITSEEIAGPDLAVDPFDPVVIAPPLRGTGWVNGNGCCAPSAHRSARLANDGNRLVKPETFAIDWVRLDGNRLFSGDGSDPADHFAFGAEVLAVADGTVVFVRDGMPEQAPFMPATGIARSLDFAGNQVVLQMAPGVFAIYAHFQPGTLRVQEGQAVAKGQVLGLLGNTGNSFAPHLHFQVSDGPDIMTSNSLPFVIDDWTLTGTADFSDLMGEIPVAAAQAAQRETIPLELDVSAFP